jgi:hypothetical protein
MLQLDVSVVRERERKRQVLLDVSVERGRERNRQVMWWCNVGEGVADVLNALYLFHVVVIEEGASRYSPNAPIHVFFMSFFQSLVLQCAFVFLIGDWVMGN